MTQFSVIWRDPDVQGSSSFSQTKIWLRSRQSRKALGAIGKQMAFVFCFHLEKPIHASFLPPSSSFPWHLSLEVTPSTGCPQNLEPQHWDWHTFPQWPELPVLTRVRAQLMSKGIGICRQVFVITRLLFQKEKEPVARAMELFCLGFALLSSWWGGEIGVPWKSVLGTQLVARGE